MTIPPPGQLAALEPAVAGWLGRVLPGPRITGVTSLGGGHRNRNLLIATAAGPAYVLRLYGPGPVTEPDPVAARTCAVEAALARRLRGVAPVPEVVAAGPALGILSPAELTGLRELARRWEPLARGQRGTGPVRPGRPADQAGRPPVLRPRGHRDQEPARSVAGRLGGTGRPDHLRPALVTRANRVTLKRAITGGLMAAAAQEPEMTPLAYGHLRTSQADRERAIDVLKAAFAEGRLDQEEYVERMGQVHASRTYAELAALTADLPVGPLGTLPIAAGTALVPAPSAAPSSPASRTARPVSALAVAALLFGVASVAVPGLLPASVGAVLLCVMALGRLGADGQRGAGLALTGGALGLLGAMGSMYMVTMFPYFH
jgi:hypothetical protein